MKRRGSPWYVVLSALVPAFASSLASGQIDSATARPGAGYYIQRPTLQIGAGAGYEVGWLNDRRNVPMTPEGFSEHLELRSPRMFGERWGLMGRVERQRQEALTAERIGVGFEGLQIDLLTTARLPLWGTIALGTFVGYRSADSIGYDYGDYDPMGSPVLREVEVWHGMRLGGLALLSFPIPLMKDLELEAEFRARLDMVPPENVGHQAPVSLGAGLTLHYSLAELPPLHYIPDLSTSLDLHALDDAGKATRRPLIHEGDVIHTRHLELAPVIAFDPSSADLPSSYAIRSAPDGFRSDSVARLDPVTIDRHRPDLIGAWLAAAPGAIRLVATVVEGEREDRARGRAESVRRYLAGSWRIDVTTMTIALEPGPRREVRVERGSESTMMVDATWSETRMVVPPLRIEPDIESEVGVKSWRLRLMSDGREIARQTSDRGDGEMDMKSLARSLARDTVRSPLIAELVVEDLAGGVSTALDTLSFSYGGRAPLDSVAEFLLLGTPPSDGLTARIIAAAGTGARVTITPLSDDDAIREAASTLARRLVRKKLAARVGSPEGGRLEGLRIEIVRRDAPHR